MERIVIEVADEIAKKWRLSPQGKKEKISQIMDVQLTKELTRDSPEEFKKFLDEVGKTMDERGLTEEKLQEILEGDA